MKYRLLLAGDLHKRMKDKTTIRGYTAVCSKIQQDIMEIIKAKHVTHFISLGDWFDGGYGSDVAAALAHTDIDHELAKLVDGNFYGLIGNHIRLNMDSNPELFLIQPHEHLKSRHHITRSEQIIRTPKDLMLNGVQISFMHWDKSASSAWDYKPMINPEAKYHIALFHTEDIIPTQYLHDMGMVTIQNDNSKIANALDKVDLAIVGHVHKPIGTFRIDKPDGTATTMIVPGSLTNTDAGMGSRHNSIEMPMIDIDEDGTVTISMVFIDLRTNELTFLKKQLDEDARNKLKSLRGNNKETLYEDLEAASFIGDSGNAFISLNAFMQQQGYTENDRSLIRLVLNEPENVNKMLETYMSDVAE